MARRKRRGVSPKETREEQFLQQCSAMLGDRITNFENLERYVTDLGAFVSTLAFYPKHQCQMDISCQVCLDPTEGFPGILCKLTSLGETRITCVLNPIKTSEKGLSSSSLS